MNIQNNQKVDIAELIKKPKVQIGAGVLLVMIILVAVFGRSEGQDPIAVSIKNLGNRHSATIEMIDEYSKTIRSANLRSNLSQTSIILTADKAEIDAYYKEAFKGAKPVKASTSAKMKKDLKESLDQSAILNNLDADLQKAVRDELVGIKSDTAKVRAANPDKKKLQTLMDKITLNTDTVIGRIEEPL
jgi:hypothetical protein